MLKIKNNSETLIKKLSFVAELFIGVLSRNPTKFYTNSV